MDYLEGHKNSGIKVGDYVKVATVACSGEGGWNAFWLSQMYSYLGEIRKVVYDDGIYGFQLENAYGGDGCLFPYFVLEKVEKINSIENIITTNSTCPRCSSVLEDKISIGLGEMVKKCPNCGWC